MPATMLFNLPSQPHLLLWIPQGSVTMRAALSWLPPFKLNWPLLPSTESRRAAPHRLWQPVGQVPSFLQSLRDPGQQWEERWSDPSPPGRCVGSTSHELHGSWFSSPSSQLCRIPASDNNGSTDSNLDWTTGWLERVTSLPCAPVSSSVNKDNLSNKSPGQ